MSFARQLRILSVLTLSAGLLTAVVPAASASAPPVNCPSTSTTITVPQQPPNTWYSCTVDTQSVTTTSQKPAVYIGAKVAFNDTRTADPVNRIDFILHVLCNDGAGGPVLFNVSAAHNIWPGMGSVALVAKGVFTPPQPGTYLCWTHVTQDIKDKPKTYSYSIDNSPSGHYLTPYLHDAGGSSPGPNDGNWSPNSPEIATSSAATEISKTGVTLGLPAGSQVGATQNMRITLCGYSDVQNGYCVHQMPSGTGLTVRVYLQAWQAADTSTTNVCPGTTTINTYQDLAISYNTHHSTSATVVSSSDPSALTLAAGCPSKVWVKQMIRVVSSSSYVYVGGQGSGAGVYGDAS